MTCANEKPALIRIDVYLNSEGYIRGKNLTNSFFTKYLIYKKGCTNVVFQIQWWMSVWTHILIIVSVISLMGFPCGSAGKESTCNVGDLGSIPGLGRFPGEGKGYPLQYSGLENSMDSIVHAIPSHPWLSDFLISLISLIVPILFDFIWPGLLVVWMLLLSDYNSL